MRNYKYSMIFAGALSLLITSSEGLAYNCTQAPDCASLGYTMSATDCQDKIAVKCPTDSSKVFCKKEALPQAALPILYGDGTVTKDIISGKTPIGVVFDETNKLAIALTDVKKAGTAGVEAMPWSNKDCDIAGLTNCSSSNVTCSPDGRENTNAILNTADNLACQGTTAATACNNYAPTGCAKDFCKKQKWFLASAKEWLSIKDVWSALEDSLNTIGNGAKALSSGRYWTSNEQDNHNALIYITTSSSINFSGKPDNTYYTRPVVYYGESKAATPTNAFQIVYSLLEIDCTSSPRSGKLTMRATATSPLPNAVTVTVKGNIPNTNNSSNNKEIDTSIQFPSGFTGGEQTADVSVTPSECLWLKTAVLSGGLHNTEGSITGLNSSWNIKLLSPEVTIIKNATGSSGSQVGGVGSTDTQGVEVGYDDCQISKISGGTSLSAEWVYECH